jgi:CHASE2 domain-containing sensor protein
MTIPAGMKVMTSRSSFIRVKGAITGLASAAAILGLFLYRWPFSRVELRLYDAASTWLRAEDAAPEEIVIAAIDSASLEALGGWPWPRAQHARAIEQLTEHGAKAIYLDVGIFRPDREHPENDRRLVEATAAAGSVVLPMIFDEVEEDGRARLVPVEPLPELALAASGVAHAHLELGEDEVVRSVRLAYRTGDRIYWGPSVELVRRYFGLSYAAIRAQGSSVLKLGELPIPVESSPPDAAGPYDDYEMNIAFVGRPGFERVSAVEVIEGRFPPGSFEGKIVFYGMTAEGFGDGYRTTSSSAGRMMGVEVQANATATILSRRFTRRIGIGWITATTLLAAVGIGWIRERWTPSSSRRFLLSLLAIAAAAYFLLLGPFGFWIQITPVGAAVILAYFGTDRMIRWTR